jgi:hypothetical protein
LANLDSQRPESMERIARSSVPIISLYIQACFGKACNTLEITGYLWLHRTGISNKIEHHVLFLRSVCAIGIHQWFMLRRTEHVSSMNAGDFLKLYFKKIHTCICLYLLIPRFPDYLTYICPARIPQIFQGASIHPLNLGARTLQSDPYLPQRHHNSH